MDRASSKSGTTRWNRPAGAGRRESAVGRRALCTALLLLATSVSCRRAEAPPPAPGSAVPPVVLDAGPTPLAPDAGAGSAVLHAAPAADPAEELTARTYDVLLEGSTVYRGTTAGVVIEDVTEPARPVRLGVAALPGSVNDVVWIGRVEQPFATACPAVPDGDGCRPPPPLLLIAAAAGPEGVVLFDVTDPVQPRQVSRFDTPGAAMRIAVAWPLLYIADGANGIVVLDAADPSRPAMIGGWNGEPPRADTAAPGMPCVPPADGGEGCAAPAAPAGSAPYARDVVLFGQRLFVAAGFAGLVVLEVRNPQRVAGPLSLVPLVSLDTPGDARAVAVDGDRVFIADGPAGLQVADVGLRGPDPEPGLVASYPTLDVCRDVQLDVNRDKSLFPPAAYLAVGDRGLAVLDFSDLASLKPLGAHVPARPVNRVTVGPNGLLLLANDSDGLMIVNAGDPTAIRQVFPPG